MAVPRQLERGSGVGRRALVALFVLLIAVITVLAVGAVVSAELLQPPSTDDKAAGGDPQQERGTAVTPTITPTEAPIPTPVPGAQQVIVTEDELNARLQQNPDQFKPFEDVSIEITDGEVLLHAGAQGLSGTYRGQLEAQNGKLVVTNGRIDGMLGWVLPEDQITSMVNRQLLAALNQGDVVIQEVAVQPGQIVLTVLPA